jgi:hypothetical protein
LDLEGSSVIGIGDGHAGEGAEPVGQSEEILVIARR